MTQLAVMTPQDPNTGLTNARLRLTNSLPLKDPVGINDQLASMTTTRLKLTNTYNIIKDHQGKSRWVVAYHLWHMGSYDDT